MKNSGFRSLPASAAPGAAGSKHLTVAKSVPNLPIATSLVHRIGENAMLLRNGGRQSGPKLQLNMRPSFVKNRNSLNKKTSMGSSASLLVNDSFLYDTLPDTVSQFHDVVYNENQ